MSQFTFPALEQASFVYPSPSSSRTNSPATTNVDISNRYRGAPSARRRPKLTPTITLGPNGWQLSPRVSVSNEIFRDQNNLGYGQFPHYQPPPPLPYPLVAAPVQQQGWNAAIPAFFSPSSADSVLAQPQNWMPATSTHSMQHPPMFNGYQQVFPPTSPGPVSPSTDFDPLANSALYSSPTNNASYAQQQPFSVPACTDIQPPLFPDTYSNTDSTYDFLEDALSTQLSSFPVEISYANGLPDAAPPNKQPTKTPKDMKTHQHVHDKEPQFHCVFPNCGKGLARKDSLKRHATNARIHPQ